MSLVTEILDRLTGIAVVKAQLDITAEEVRKLGDWLLDIEKRMIRLESGLPLGAPATARRPRLPGKPAK